MFGNLYYIGYLIPSFLIIIISYLIGCINTSLVITKLFKTENDIRKLGSGNAGFTNVLRTMGKTMALFTFLGDFLKGIVAVLLSLWIVSLFPVLSSNDVSIKCALCLSGVMCVLGHIYPCFFEFKGGKGVLTTWATSLFIDWRIFLVLIFVFLIVFFISKIVSLSSICAAVSLPVSTAFFTYFIDYKITQNLQSIIFPTVCAFLICILVIYKHKSNISRLLKSEEKKVSVHK